MKIKLFPYPDCLITFLDTTFLNRYYSNIKKDGVNKKICTTNLDNLILCPPHILKRSWVQFLLYSQDVNRFLQNFICDLKMLDFFQIINSIQDSF